MLDVGRDEATGAPYLVMEYLVGEDVQQLSERLGPVAPDLALRVGVQALLGLGRAHAQGIVHRDVKPANLFLTERDGGEVRVKVLDFGIAKVTTGELESGEKKRPITRTGSFVGSPLYMSPEQTRGKGMVDHRSDLWSLGIVIYQMLAGRTPFDHIESLGDFIVAVRGTPVDPIRLHAPWVDPVIARAVERALVIEPAARYQSAEEMRAALASFLPQGASITAAMLVPTRPEEGPPTPLGPGTALAATTPAGALTPAAPSASSSPALAAQGTPSALSASRTVAMASQGTLALGSAGTPAPSPGTPSQAAFQGNAPVQPVTGSTQPSPQQPRQPGSSGRAGLLFAGALIAAVAGGLVLTRAFLRKGGPRPGPTTTATSPATVPAPVPDAGALPAELAALAGTWRSDGGLQYDAEPAGEALRFRIHDAATLAAQGYEDGDVQFVLRAHAGTTGSFRVDARMRPQPPPGTSYDRVHSRKTCMWTWTEADGEPLRAELQGDRLEVELVRIDAPVSVFVREGGGTRIKECSGLGQAPVVPTELWLSRGALHDAGAPREAPGLGGFFAPCTNDAQCALHNCFQGRCRHTGFEARCHGDANCSSHRCVSTHCR